MEEDNKFWKIITTAICFVIVSIGGCNAAINHQDNSAMVEMVSQGADPLDARCAIKSSASTECGIRAATKNK